MADFYVDHGAYATVIGATPTWGAPQEGDGSALAPSTAAGTVSVDLSSTTSNAGTVSVFGSSGISFAASSGATLAGNIAAAINASTATVTNTALEPTAQVRNVVYARATGALLEVMCRIGSSSLNVLGVVWGGTWTAGPPGNLTFSGGVSGCWGYLVNTAAMGVSNSIAALAYGIIVAPPICRTAVLTIDDQVWARTGNNPTLTYSGASCDLRRRISASGSSAYPLNLIFDTNTKWTADGATGTCTFNLTLSGAFSPPGIVGGTGTSYLNVVAPCASSFGALRDGGVVFNIIASTQIDIQLGPMNSSGSSAPTAYNQNHTMFGVNFFDNSIGGNAARLVSPSSGSGGGEALSGEYAYRSCRFVRTLPIAGVPVTRFVINNNGFVQTRLRFIGCSFESNVSGAAVSPIVDLSTSSVGPKFGHSFIFRQCSFTGFSGGGDSFPLHNTISSINEGCYNGVQIEATDCTGLALAASYAGITQAAFYSSMPDLWYILLHSPLSGGPFRYENFKGICEFNPGASPAQPTLSAIQPSGQAWSIHARWLAVSNAVSRGSGWRLPPLRASYVDSTGVRIIKTRALLSSALFTALVPGDMVATLSYVSDTTGKVVSESQLIPSSSLAVWAEASGYASHVSKEFSFTTSDPVRQGTEVVVQIELFGAPRTGVSESVFFDPEVSVT